MFRYSSLFISLSLVACGHAHPYADCTVYEEGDKAADGTIDMHRVEVFNADERLTSSTYEEAGTVIELSRTWDGACAIEQSMVDEDDTSRFTYDVTRTCDGHDELTYMSQTVVSEVKDDWDGSWVVMSEVASETWYNNRYEDEDLVRQGWASEHGGEESGYRRLAWGEAGETAEHADSDGDGVEDIHQRWTYDDDGQVAQYTFTDDFYASTITTTYTWDDDRLVSEEVENDGDGELELRTTYEYDGDWVVEALRDIIGSDEYDEYWTYDTQCP